jgi:cullin 1
MFYRRNPKQSNNEKEKNTPKGRPQTVFEDKWKLLQDGVDKLIEFLDSDQRRPFDNNEYANLYSTVYNLCTQKVDTGKLNGGPTELLYDRYRKCISQYLTDRVVPSLKEKQGEVLLMEAVKRWRDHQIVVRYMGKLFSYLDRYYTKHNNRDSLKDVGLKCYQQLVYESIKKDMAQALLDKVHKERIGESIDRAVMKDGVTLFIEMGLNTLTAYEKDFEAPLIHETSSFYKRESARWIAEDSCPDYMRKAEDRLLQEQARAQAYLHSTTEQTLIKKVEAELITDHQTQLIDMENSGFIPLLKDYKTDDLSRMYRLFKRINNQKPMAERMRDYVKQEGTNIVESYQEKDMSDTANCSTYIEALLDLHEKYSKLVNDQFEKDNFFLEALKDAFTSFVNADLESESRQTKTSTAELLSTYCDTIMKGTDKVGEDKLEDVLERIVRLFGYISDKDMFQEFYRRQLSKRLLVASRSNHDAERSLIAKLKMRCGASFTSKLEGMIKDKSLSEDMQNNFTDFVKQKGAKLEIDFSPQVLTTGFWPAFKIDNLIVPTEFQICLDFFKDFYNSRTESRSLKWVHSLGTCQVLGRYEEGNKDLLMSTYQACCILLFNQTPEISAQDVQKALQLPFDDIKKNLLSLCVSKNANIIKKTGSAKKVEPTDMFSVNEEFKNKNRRIKIPNLVLKISKEEVQDINNTTQEDRKHAIEAAIVRLMKARKKMDHQTLVMECSKQLMSHFMPDPKVIKRRIEDLISREYLSRDDKQTNIYNYLA